MSEVKAEQPERKQSWELDEGEEIIPGRYALRRLGGGYDYEAYLSWDDHLFALVVAKCLRPNLVGDSHALRVLKREARHLERLNHPVVVRGFGAVTDGPRPHILMEYLEGPNLASLIRRYGPVELEQLLPLALQICSAIHYLAAERVVHLDVKPRNIIMGAPPRLIDMSIARSFSRAKELTSPVGTDAYMAPEQCEPGKGKCGPASDVWGLGSTLYHAIVAKVPFPRPDYDATMHKNDLQIRFPQLHKPPEPFPKSVPQPIQDIVNACLHPDPGARPSISDVVGWIEPLVAQLPTKPVLRKLRPRLRPRPRRPGT
jgi:eukaryotic-like serine/threonine-protein kinase